MEIKIQIDDNPIIVLNASDITGRMTPMLTVISGNETKTIEIKDGDFSHFGEFNMMPWQVDYNKDGIITEVEYISPYKEELEELESKQTFAGRILKLMGVR